eukprot:375127-Amorphochlora_amoeboformis.AAC.1
MKERTGVEGAGEGGSSGGFKGGGTTSTSTTTTTKTTRTTRTTKTRTGMATGMGIGMGMSGRASVGSGTGNIGGGSTSGSSRGSGPSHTAGMGMGMGRAMGINMGLLKSGKGGGMVIGERDRSSLWRANTVRSKTKGLALLSDSSPPNYPETYPVTVAVKALSRIIHSLSLIANKIPSSTSKPNLSPTGSRKSLSNNNQTNSDPPQHPLLPPTPS